MKEFNTTSTGKRVVINCATMDEVKRLKQVIFTQLKAHPLGLKIVGNADNIFNKDVDITGVFEFIKNVLLGIDSSDDFDEALYACLKHCTYDTALPINKDLFDRIRPEAREDYYEIAFACIEENLRPFLKSLVSIYKTRMQGNINIQKLFQAEATKSE